MSKRKKHMEKKRDVRYILDEDALKGLMEDLTLCLLTHQTGNGWSNGQLMTVFAQAVYTMVVTYPHDEPQQNIRQFADAFINMGAMDYVARYCNELVDENEALRGKIRKLNRINKNKQ